MNESIQVRSHSAAPSVERHLPEQVICEVMIKHILKSNHIAAPNVKNGSPIQLLWRFTKEHTLERNHIDADTVIHILGQPVIEAHMKENCINSLKLCSATFKVIYRVRQTRWLSQSRFWTLDRDTGESYGLSYSVVWWHILSVSYCILCDDMVLVKHTASCVVTCS